VWQTDRQTDGTAIELAACNTLDVRGARLKTHFAANVAVFWKYCVKSKLVRPVCGVDDFFSSHCRNCNRHWLYNYRGISTGGIFLESAHLYARQLSAILVTTHSRACTADDYLHLVLCTVHRKVVSPLSANWKTGRRGLCCWDSCAGNNYTRHVTLMSTSLLHVSLMKAKHELVTGWELDLMMSSIDGSGS